MRALLRFLYVARLHRHALARRRRAPWDGGIEDPRAGSRTEQVAGLLAGCDRGTTGRRDFAILTVLARLGLRANEVAMLRLEDVDWRAGEITVHGKGNRTDRLPLPVDVGQAIADYCRRGRPRLGCRALFVRAARPVCRADLRRGEQIVPRRLPAGRAAVRLARIGCGTPRRASLRRAGAPCRDRPAAAPPHAVTTAGYARDRAALAELARRWPGGAA